MRKFGLFVATALILAAFGGWVTSLGQTRLAGPIVTGPQINVMQMMTNAANLPVEHVVDPL